MCAVKYNQNDTYTQVKLESSVAGYLVKKLGADSWFVYIDQYRTRGTDLPLKEYAHGLITISAHTTKVDFAQGIMRMRKLLHSQSITVLLPQELADIKNFKQLNLFLQETQKAQIAQDAPQIIMMQMTHEVRQVIFDHVLRLFTTPEVEAVTKITSSKNLIKLCEEIFFMTMTQNQALLIENTHNTEEIFQALATKLLQLYTHTDLKKQAPESLLQKITSVYENRLQLCAKQLPCKMSATQLIMPQVTAQEQQMQLSQETTQDTKLDLTNEEELKKHIANAKKMALPYNFAFATHKWGLELFRTLQDTEAQVIQDMNFYQVKTFSEFQGIAPQLSSNIFATENFAKTSRAEQRCTFFKPTVFVLAITTGYSNTYILLSDSDAYILSSIWDSLNTAQSMCLFSIYAQDFINVLTPDFSHRQQLDFCAGNIEPLLAQPGQSQWINRLDITQAIQALKLIVKHDPQKTSVIDCLDKALRKADASKFSSTQPLAILPAFAQASSAPILPEKPPATAEPVLAYH